MGLTGPRQNNKRQDTARKERFVYLCESTISDDEANDSLCVVASPPFPMMCHTKFAGPEEEKSLFRCKHKVGVHKGEPQKKT